MTESPVEFGDNTELWSVGRGGVRRWLHCHVPDISALPESQRDELAAWLAERRVEAGVSLVVTRDDSGGHYVGSVAVAVAELPDWLQRPDPQPKPVKAAKARK